MDRAARIALEEYLNAAEELFAHLTADHRQNPPRLAFLVRQLGSARETIVASNRAFLRPPG